MGTLEEVPRVQNGDCVSRLAFPGDRRLTRPLYCAPSPAALRAVESTPQTDQGAKREYVIARPSPQDLTPMRNCRIPSDRDL